MINHSVYFKLKHDKGSKQEQQFLQSCAILEKIPKVTNFQIVKEVSPKNNFDFGLVMQFTSEEDYLFYCEHPEHQAFVENIWIPNVSEFQEIDYKSLT